MTEASALDAEWHRHNSGPSRDEILADVLAVNMPGFDAAVTFMPGGDYRIETTYTRTFEDVHQYNEWVGGLNAGD